MRRIPLWARWLGTLLAFALLIFVIHTVVRTSGASSEASPEAEIDRVSEIVIAQDQAPHTAPLLPGDTARSGLQSAIAADVRNRIRREELTGPCRTCAVHPPVRREPDGVRSAARCAPPASPFRFSASSTNARKRSRGASAIPAREQRAADRADQQRCRA